MESPLPAEKITFHDRNSPDSGMNFWYSQRPKGQILVNADQDGHRNTYPLISPKNRIQYLFETE